uniref:Cystatin domain-containing protein n=1 Tax=Strongyloides venezuelensis TaxID=75913 RepID=A0A0K0FPG3_STRVS
MCSIINFSIFILLLLASVNYSISIALYNPISQLPPTRPGYLVSSLIPDFGFQDIFPEFGLDKILAGLNLGHLFPGFLKPSKPVTPPVSGEEEKKPSFQPTVVFNETLKKEECQKTINSEKGSDYTILKYEVVSHLIRNNDTDFTLLQFNLQWNHSGEKDYICTEFVGSASNMTRKCDIIECEWYVEETTTIEPTIKPSGKYVMINKINKQIIEQYSKYGKL